MKQQSSYFIRSIALTLAVVLCATVLFGCQRQRDPIGAPLLDEGGGSISQNAAQGGSSTPEPASTSSSSNESSESAENTESSESASIPESSSSSSVVASSTSAATSATSEGTVAANPAEPRAAGQSDFDFITSHVGLWNARSLSFTRPSGNTSTSGSNYFMTGLSNPQYDLYINGSIVDTRGVSGSWGFMATLSPGENVFQFENGGETKTIVITQGPDKIYTTDKITSMFPSYDAAFQASEDITLKCNAPSGAQVIATVNGRSYQLTQNAAASTGVNATYSASYSADVSGVQNMGQVTYTLHYNGTTKNYTSAGSLYVVGSGATLVVQATNTAATVFATSSTDGSFFSTMRQDAVDYVTDYTDTMYRLSMGGWVPKNTCKPSQSGYQASVSGVTFQQHNKGESYVFTGTGAPTYKASHGYDTFSITFYNTTGIGNVPIDQSGLFSSVSVTEDGNATTLTFQLKQSGGLWGYLVEYAKGSFSLYCKRNPQLSTGDTPLAGITIAIDPGHGGTDSGAVGMAGTKGAMEKNINWDTSIAVKKRLEMLGANVVLTRSGDENPDLNQRLALARDAKPDLFIALHCNSILLNSDGNKPKGVEVYYYEGIAKPLAVALNNNISSYVGRTSRGAKHSNFRVTLNSHAPSVLVEMGFLSNPIEYDNMCTRQAIYNTAMAVGDGVIAALR